MIEGALFDKLFLKNRNNYSYANYRSLQGNHIFKLYRNTSKQRHLCRCFYEDCCYFVGSGPFSSNQFLPLLANLSRVNSSLTDFVFGSK